MSQVENTLYLEKRIDHLKNKRLLKVCYLISDAILENPVFEKI